MEEQNVILKSNEKLLTKLTNYVTKNQEKLYRLVYHYCQDQEASMDILQEAITKAITKLYTLHQEQYLETWFYRILINESIRYTQKHKKEKQFSIENYEIEAIDEDITESIVLYEKIEELTPKERTVIFLRFFEERKLEEIALITKTNINTVKSRLYQALAKLKMKLGGNR